ncbi:hypothetical protein GALMADRAFT_237086 [Galerina marginata CBS 339.88]|uniref:Uncharacterized protein n=1 Tax=Galerina marginata (strain CBS 339.88) TaxID=685588 RepID=A0A067TWG5_GALM3|nr:hypothetical protein GALMADRAFT_237086 [Galerina marginata CBS 339.88]
MSIRRPKVIYLRSPSPDSDVERQPYWYRSPSPETACQPNNYVKPFSLTRYYSRHRASSFRRYCI